MSQGPFGGRGAEEGTGAAEGRVLEDESERHRLLAALDDEDSRAILRATADEARSASELAEDCDLPPSTAYRKLERLTDVGLLGQRTRIRTTGKHVSEYRRVVDEVVVGFDAGGLSVEIERGESSRAVSPGVVIADD